MGYPIVMPISGLDSTLAFLFGSGQENDLWVRLGFADKPDGARFETGRDYAAEYNNPYGQSLPGDRDALLKLHERYPAAHFRDITGAMDQMRNIKRPGEIEVLRRNGRISALGDKQAIEIAHPNMYEYQIEAEAEYVFRNAGAQGLAYPAIVGSGIHANTWHYFFDRDQIKPGSIVVFDFAADLDHMTMDITRTFNIDGKFTPEQAKWYNVDLESQKATIAMLKVGNTYEQAADAGKAVFEKAGEGAQWMGFPGTLRRAGYARRHAAERTDPGGTGRDGRADRRVSRQALALPRGRYHPDHGERSGDSVVGNPEGDGRRGENGGQPARAAVAK